MVGMVVLSQRDIVDLWTWSFPPPSVVLASVIEVSQKRGLSGALVPSSKLLLQGLSPAAGWVSWVCNMVMGKLKVL